jgi:F-type H+-transporting ATPase subunit O
VLRTQELDTKTINRLEKAVAKSEFSQGKKLKVVTKVSFDHRLFSLIERQAN